MIENAKEIPIATLNNRYPKSKSDTAEFMLINVRDTHTVISVTRHK